MKNKNSKHIFFDLDHTLWDFDKNSELTFDTIFKSKHPTVATEFFLEKYIPINHACWKLYQVDKITHEELRYNRLKHSFDAINYVISDEEIEVVADAYIALLPDNNHLFEGAIAILDYLHPKYNLHIITNGFAEVQQRKLKNAQIEKYFETITNSEMAGVKKPNPIIFEYALDLAKAKKTESVMIGDCIDADINGALNFGIAAIYFNPNKNEVSENIATITSLLQLKNYF